MSNIRQEKGLEVIRNRVVDGAELPDDESRLFECMVELGVVIPPNSTELIVNSLVKGVKVGYRMSKELKTSLGRFSLSRIVHKPLLELYQSDLLLVE